MESDRISFRFQEIWGTQIWPWVFLAVQRSMDRFEEVSDKQEHAKVDHWY